MFGKKKPKKNYRTVHDVYDRVKRKLALIKGEEDPLLPSFELREKIAKELREFREKEEQRKKALTQIKTKPEIPKGQETAASGSEENTKKTGKGGIYGDYTPPPLYVRASQRKKEQLKLGRISRYKVLPPGSKPLDFLTHLPTVLRRFFYDLRDPIPVLDKLLFLVVYLIAYFITVIVMVGHYKFIKPDINYVVQIDNQYVELIVKQEDIPALKITLGDNWLQKLGRHKLENQVLSR